MELSENTLGHHGAGYLHKAGYIGALDIVDITVGLGAIFDTLLMNVAHDLLETGIDLLLAPGELLGVLSHLETRD